MVIGSREPKGPVVISWVAEVVCRYCGLDDPRCLVYCADARCRQWFCNGKTGDLQASHIVEHGVLSAHQKLAFWNEAAWQKAFASTGREAELAKDARWVARHCTIQPQCYMCDESNIFELGVADPSRPWIRRNISCRSDTVKYNMASGQWNPFKTCHEKSFVCFASWACRIPKLGVMKALRNRWIPEEIITKSFLKDLEEWTRRSENGVVKDFASWRDERIPLGSLALLEKTDYVQHYRALVAALRQLEIDSCESYVGLTDLRVQWNPRSEYDAIMELPFGLHSGKIHPGQRITLNWDVPETGESRSEPGSITTIAELPHAHVVTVHIFTALSVGERASGRGYRLKIEYSPIVFDRMLAALKKIEEDDPSAMSREIRAVLLDSFYGLMLGDEPVMVPKADPGPGLGNSNDIFDEDPRVGPSSSGTTTTHQPSVHHTDPFNGAPIVGLLPAFNPAFHVPVATFQSALGTRLTLTINPNGLQPLLVHGDYAHYNHGRPSLTMQQYLTACSNSILLQLRQHQLHRLSQLSLTALQRPLSHRPVPPPPYRDDKSVLGSVTDRLNGTVFFNPPARPPTATPNYGYSKVVQPPGLRAMNPYQRLAVSYVLENSVTLIQGPPGTGKTTTAAAVAYNLAVETFELRKILCVAQSNLAVDHLADQIGKTGISVARMYASSRDLPARSNLNFEIVPKEKDAVHCHQIICVTCNCAGMSCLQDLSFPYVIIDEATQAMEPDALIAITKGCKKLVLIGDQEQLGSVITYRELQGSSLSKSLFERFLEHKKIPKVLLQQQYRMNPRIRQMVNAVTYGKDGGLCDGFEPNEAPHLPAISFVFPKSNIPMVFVHVPVNQEYSGSGRSLLNMGEAHFIARLVANLTGQESGWCVRLQDIGIISFYKGQISHLRHQLAHHPHVGVWGAEQVEVASVDGFQGREKEVIILSCVRSGDKARVHGFGFTDDKKRLNVAMSRARAGLIIVGNSSLYTQSPIWLEYFQHIPIVRLPDIGARLPIKCSCGEYQPAGGPENCMYCDFTSVEDDLKYEN